LADLTKENYFSYNKNHLHSTVSTFLHLTVLLLQLAQMTDTSVKT